MNPIRASAVVAALFILATVACGGSDDTGGAGPGDDYHEQPDPAKYILVPRDYQGDELSAI